MIEKGLVRMKVFEVEKELVVVHIDVGNLVRARMPQCVVDEVAKGPKLNKKYYIFSHFWYQFKS